MGIVGTDGKPIDTEMLGTPRVYEASGIRIETPLTPAMALQRALAGAQQGVGQNTALAVLQQGGSQAEAQAAAAKAASSLQSPFQVEPCAEAVFMILTQELEWRDELISALASRLKELDGKDLPERKVEEQPENKDAN